MRAADTGFSGVARGRHIQYGGGGRNVPEKVHLPVYFSSFEVVVDTLSRPVTSNWHEPFDRTSESLCVID